MKAPRFHLVRPRDLAEALDRLAEPGGLVKVLAGGQSLGPMLNLRLVRPDLLVDVSGLPELRRVGREDDALVVGACVTHADFEDGRAPDVGSGMLARVASGIAYRAVRNRGTIGGSLAHADPAADWLSTLSAFGAEVEIASRSGTRRTPIGAFVTGALATTLAPGELVVAVRIPQVSAQARLGFVKHARKIGEFAHAIGAALVDPERGVARAVAGALDAAPLVIEDARELFDRSAGFDRTEAGRRLAAAGLADTVDRHLHVEALGRALAEAFDAPPGLRRAA
ncbi:FAD binding domain-containing protein [Chelatococcus sambhunathii]|uniref:FAD binding domain-containing protein n=1 Tax=Chelatococcus sambhunathii TaxID=363953 RepID=A0ABU1DIT3_9HYPH|nr:FAD binding domain-containing protein [Chelatococcus sambhunathii]MDR4308004.1 FAD binding domain-containing protein [Chelatococcus sambhunathii]